MLAFSSNTNNLEADFGSFTFGDFNTSDKENIFENKGQEQTTNDLSKDFFANGSLFDNNAPLVKLGKRTNPYSSDNDVKSLKKQKLNPEDIEIKSIADEFLVSIATVEEKKRNGTLDEYITKKKDKYADILEEARGDYASISSQYYTPIGQENLLKSKTNGIEIQENTLMKIIRKSNLLLSEKCSMDPDVVFSVDSFPGSILAQRNSDKLSLLSWSGKIEIQSSHPDFLGEGSFGTAQKIQDLSNGTFAALKMSSYAQANSSIDNEVSKLALIHSQMPVPGLQLPAENIVHVESDHGTTLTGYTQRLYNLGDIPTSHSKGIDFSQIKRAEALEIFRELLTGLKYIHDINLIHGDIKPENCFLERDDNGKIHMYLADLGDAKQKGKDLVMNPDDFMGTVNAARYFTKTDEKKLQELSHETSDNNWVNSNKSRDVFALAMTIWEAVTELPAYNFTWSISKLYPDTSRQKINENTVRMVLGDEATNVLIKALAEDPVDRPTAAEMLQAFTR